MGVLEEPALFDDDNAEVNLLAGICNNCHEVAKCAMLEPEDFSNETYGHIFSKMRELYLSHGAFTAFELPPHFPELGNEKQVRKLFFNLMKAGEIRVDLTPSLVRAIKHASAKRNFTKALEAAKTDLERKQLQPILTEMYEQLIELEMGTTNDSNQSASDVVGDIIESFKHDPLIYKTGLQQLDFCLGGGFYAGKAYGFAARKKGGKTALLGTLAYNLNMAGITTLYIALEMGRTEIMQRLVARGINEPPIKFLTEQRKNPKFQEKVVEFYRANPQNLHFVDKAGISFTQIKKELLFQFQKLKPKVIIIDYWQLIKGKSDKVNAAEHLDDVAQWMKEFAKKYNVALICASQINQEGNTRGGEGMRIAFDQVYQLHRIGDEKTSNLIWAEMMDTRYTPWGNIGSEHQPAFMINPNGVYFEEM